MPNRLGAVASRIHSRSVPHEANGEAAAGQHTHRCPLLADVDPRKRLPGNMLTDQNSPSVSAAFGITRLMNRPSASIAAVLWGSPTKRAVLQPPLKGDQVSRASEREAVA
jgi:hypothetical protein